MYHTFLKQFKADLAAVKASEPLVEKGDELLSDAGMHNSNPPSAEWVFGNFVQRFEQNLGDRKDIPITLQTNNDYAKDLHYTRLNLKSVLQDAQQKDLKWWRPWADEMEPVVNSKDFKDGVPYYDLTPAEVTQLQAFPGIAQRLSLRIDMLLKRMARVQDPSMNEGIPASAEVQDLETLYHASVEAKALASKGFSLSMPEKDSSAGLGGSQSAGGGVKGISFTEDQYVAKEIARVFKEVTMIARGEVGAKAVIDWAKRGGKLKEVIDWYSYNYANLSGYKERIVSDRKGVRLERLEFSKEHLADVKAGRAEYDPSLSNTWVTVPFREAFGTPVAAMGLYLSYLNFSGRYDPKFFGIGGPPGLVRRFKGLNPNNIGYIKATIDMTNPNITYGTGEREFRVPPEAVVSVDRFIG